MENEDIVMNRIPVEEHKETTDNKKCEPKKCKCCLQLTLSIIAVVGVIVLFVLYFTGKSCSGTSKAAKGSKSGVSIAYINNDTIMAKYDMVKTIKDSLAAKQKKATDSLEKLQNALEFQYSEYQKKLKANAYATIAQATQTENSLKQGQEDFLALKEELSSQLSDENVKMSTMLQDSITNYLKRYNSKFNYDFILSYSKNSDILYANDNLDITKEVIEGLNKDYKSKKK